MENNFLSECLNSYTNQDTILKKVNSKIQKDTWYLKFPLLVISNWV